MVTPTSPMTPQEVYRAKETLAVDAAAIAMAITGTTQLLIIRFKEINR